MATEYYSQEFLDILEVGNRVKMDYGPNNPNTKTFWVCAIVDDDQVVTKFWGISSNQWVYSVDSLYSFYLAYRNERLKEL